MTRDRALPPWLAGAAAFAVVTAGPIPLPLTVAWATITLARGARPSRDAALPLAVGAALGVIAASFRFGLGFDGFRIPALDLFAASFEQRWTSSTAMDLALLYSPPLMAAAAGAVAHAVVASRRGDLPQTTVLLVAWLVFAAGWFLASAGEATPAPLVAMALPAALLAVRPGQRPPGDAARRMAPRTVAPSHVRALPALRTGDCHPLGPGQ